MANQEQIEAAYTKIINKAPSSVLRKAAQAFWAAHNTSEGASEKEGETLIAAIKSIPLDYRSPALKCLDEFDACKANGGTAADCFSSLAVMLADRVVHG